MSKTKIPPITSEDRTPIFVLIKGICFYGSQPGKKYFSDILDKKCTFEVTVPVQMFSLQVHAFVETHVGSQAYKLGCRKAIIFGLMILIRVIYSLLQPSAE